MKSLIKKIRFKYIFWLSAIFLVYFAFCLPGRLFDKPFSTILESRDGVLLNASIAADGQWRFPPGDTVPDKFKECLLVFEDRNFESHFGVYFPSLFRAFYQNIKTGRVVSGGSTLTMQIARMSRSESRNIFQKIIEIIWAFRLELKYSKEELLNIYAANAPFGGNVVGLEAASWRYFSMPPGNLTWAQSATMAVLPNAPALIYPGKNQVLLAEKRNRVLKYLLEIQKIDSTTYFLSIEEKLPQKPYPLPSFAPHLLNYCISQGMREQRIHSNIDFALQDQLLKLCKQYQKKLDGNYIHNAAVLVVDLKSNSVISYIGNTASSKEYDSYVDIIQAPRSTGSILKPFLFASMLMEGELHNEMLIPDIPMLFEDFSPKNYQNRFDGAVRAEDALTQSLNVPAVHLLQKHGVQKFLHTLNKAGLTHINKTADHYGLSLILGGAEASLWNLTSVYAGMGKSLNSYSKSNLEYFKSDWEVPDLTKDINRDSTRSSVPYLFDRASIYLTFNALTELNRPNMESGWKSFSSSEKIAWKTGTSFGHRDAWSIGVTPDYAVGVWVGNATGEGRPGLVGVESAAPLMFDVFSKLKDSPDWFDFPESEMKEITVCSESGHRNTNECSFIDTIITHYKAERTQSCNYHKSILTDDEFAYRYYIDCSQGKELIEKTYFVLPPVQEWYFKKKSPNYSSLPPFHPDCISMSNPSSNYMEIIYPKHAVDIILTNDLNGQKNDIVFELAHRKNETKVFWHVDDEYIGYTNAIHKMSYSPVIGEHKLYVIDENGNQESVRFNVLGGE